MLSNSNFEKFSLRGRFRPKKQKRVGFAYRLSLYGRYSATATVIFADKIHFVQQRPC